MAKNNPYALSFDGVDDRVLGPQLSTHNTGTVECVIQVQHEHIGAFVGTYSTTTDGNNRQLALAVYPYTQRRFRIHISAVSTNDALIFTAITASGFTYGEPHHVAYTSQHGSGKVDLIVDGIIQDMTPEQGTMTDCFFGRVMQPSDRLQIGAKRDLNGVHSRPFRGIVDEFRLWNYVRTLEQIQTNAHRRLTGSETGLVVYYRFDEGTGNVAYDSSPNGYHGEITGATWVPGLVDLEDLAPPGRVDISATLRGSSSATAKADHIRGLSAHLAGAATATGGTPIRIRGLSANLAGTGTTNVRMNLIAALKASLQGKATLKSNVLVLFIPEGVYVIDADEIFAKDQPSRGQVVANYIEVWVNPLKPVDEPEEVYRSKDPVAIPPGATETITIHFDDEPVTEPAVALEEAGANLSIVDTKYYAWGADVKIKNAGSGAQTCIIVATGKPLKVQGREVVVKKDEVSIQENGLKKYTFDNPFVQDRATAELIADKLLSFANAKRDIVIEWRGDPALELADVTMIPEYQRRDIDQRGIFYVTKQELEFDGGLRARLEGRKM